MVVEVQHYKWKYVVSRQAEGLLLDGELRQEGETPLDEVHQLAEGHPLAEVSLRHVEILSQEEPQLVVEFPRLEVVQHPQAEALERQ